MCDHQDRPSLWLCVICTPCLLHHPCLGRGLRAGCGTGTAGALRTAAGAGVLRLPSRRQELHLPTADGEVTIDTLAGPLAALERVCGLGIADNPQAADGPSWASPGWPGGAGRIVELPGVHVFAVVAVLPGTTRTLPIDRVARQEITRQDIGGASCAHTAQPCLVRCGRAPGQFPGGRDARLAALRSGGLFKKGSRSHYATSICRWHRWPGPRQSGYPAHAASRSAQPAQVTSAQVLVAHHSRPALALTIRDSRSH